MRILIIPSWYPSEASPLNGIFVREQAKCLARRFAVTVLTPRSPSFLHQLCFRWGPAFTQANDEGIDTLFVRRLRLPSLHRIFASRKDPDYIVPYYRRFCRAIRDGFAWYVKQHGLPDVIHAHVVLPAGWIAVELGREYGVPVVLTEHSEPFSMHLGSETQRQLVHATLSGADRVVAVSSALRDVMLKYCPNLKIDVIGNIIDTTFMSLVKATGIASRRFRFLFVGMLTERKGVQHLLAAAQMLKAKGLSAFEIYVGGDGPYRSTLQKMAQELGLANQCNFLGMLTREAVRDHMQACDVFVLPSLGETFGVVLGEAMACGKPVLSTRCGGPDSVVSPETGILVAPGDPREFADAMAGFMTDRYSFDAETIRQSVLTRFGADAFLEQTEKLYRGLSTRRAPTHARTA